jgi:AcrR family transcriptional regulator
LVEVAARLLAEEGRGAVKARRVTQGAGVSTMAIYTHFGGMDELLAAIWREGYRRFGVILEEPAVTDDPVADWMTQGWAYRRFALTETHLYHAMFGPGLAAVHNDGSEDGGIANHAFGALLDRIERGVAAERFAIDDVFTAGEVAWSTVHGAMEIELSGYHGARRRDPIKGFGECLRRLAIGFGDQPDQAARSLGRSWRRAKQFNATG